MNANRIVRRTRAFIVPVMLITATMAYLLVDALHSRGSAAPEPAIPPAIVPESEEPPQPPAPSEITPERLLLTQSLEARRDPFQSRSMAVLGLEEDIKLKQKQIEVLRLSLEERQLRLQLANVGADTTRVQLTAPASNRPGPDDIELLALIDSERRKAALLSDGTQLEWVREGERFGVWRLTSVRDNRAFLASSGGATRTLSVEP